jgi:hypothetical protein
MKNLQRLTIVLFVIMLLVFLGVRYYDRAFVDRTAPVIQCDSQILPVSVHDDGDSLLKGVTARDDVDGDLTDQVVIQGVSQLITADTAKVTYVVFDSSNNMGTCTRIIQYTDYEKPRLILTQPLVFQTGEEVDILSLLQAEDRLDGDISGNIRITSQSITNTQEGVYNITVQVMNSMGDVESLPLRVIVSNSAASRKLLTLKAYITYLETGDRFDPVSYITAVNGGNISDVTIDSDVDTQEPGNYCVTYTYTVQNRVYTAFLTVVVR